ncbi:DNA primase [Caldicellulosiruptoraceae bacterium PP1]
MFEKIIDEVLRRTDIVDIVNSYVNLRKSGANYKALCPFHNERTPSFYVSPSKQIFHCFGCGVGGNVIHFVMRIENITFFEALKILASKVNINADLYQVNSQKERELLKQKEELYKLLDECTNIFHSHLFDRKNVDAVKYLLKRGIKKDTVKKFKIGYCPDNFNLYQILSEKYDSEIINKSGIFYEKDGKYYCRFNQRIIFPIFDTLDRTIAFGGRIINSDNKAKYINSPETILFNKSKTLYALNIAKNSKEDHFIIVEGYMDTISLQQEGVQNVIGVLGTALNNEHSYTIKRYKNNVILCLDSDQAGVNAALRGAEVLYQNGINVKIMELENAKDPDEYVKKFGVDAFLLKKGNSVFVLDYKIKNLLKKYDINSSEEKIKFINGYYLEILNKLQTDIEIEEYINKLSKIIDISSDALKKQFEKMKQSQQKRVINISNNKIVTPNDDSIDNRIYNSEIYLISIYFEWANKNEQIKLLVNKDDFITNENKDIFEKLNKLLDEGIELNFPTMLSFIGNQATLSELTEISSKGLNDFESAKKAILELKNNLAELNLKKQLVALDKDTDKQKYLEIIEKIKKLKMRKEG